MNNYIKFGIAIVASTFLGLIVFVCVIMLRHNMPRTPRLKIAVEEFEIEEANSFVELYGDMDVDSQIGKYLFTSEDTYEQYADLQWVKDKADIFNWEVVSQNNDMTVLMQKREYTNSDSVDYEEIRFVSKKKEKAIYFAWIQMDSVNSELDFTKHGEGKWAMSNFWPKVETYLKEEEN